MTPARWLPALALLTLLPLAGAHSFAGALAQGEADAYVVDHDSRICGDAITTWHVTLTYAPASDTLTLVVPGHGAEVGRGGVATVSFQTQTTCAFFTVVVHGTLVRDVATYQLTTSR